MKMLGRQLLVCLLFLVVIGCDSKVASVEKAPLEKAASVKENSKSAVSDRSASNRKAKIDLEPREGRKMISLSSLDKWNDLPEEVRKQLYQKKTTGATEISEWAFSNLRAKYDLQFAVEKLRKESWQPVLAKSKPSQAPFQYATEPATADVRLQRELAFRLVGIDAFLERDIDGVELEIKKEVEELVRKTFSTGTQKLRPEDWNEIRTNLRELCRLYPALEQDSQTQYCLGRVNEVLKDFKMADTRFEAAAKNLEGTEYPASFAVEVHASVFSIQKYLMFDKAPALRLAKYYLAVVYWLENDFRALPYEHRTAYEMVDRFIETCISKGKWDLLVQFKKDVSNQKHLPKWLKSMCRGKFNNKIAWRYRGNGYPNSIAKKNWVRFEQYQEIAAEEFEKAYKANPMFPEAASELIGISMTGHSEQSEEYWFEKVMEAQVDYMPAYRRRLMSLLPQWGGSVQEMFDFAKLHAEKEQYDTGVPFVLIEFHYKLLRDVSGEQRKLAVDLDVIRATIKAIDGLMTSWTAQPSNRVQVDESYYLTLKAILATKGELYDIAYESFELLDDKFSPLAADDLRVPSIAIFRGKAYALGGEYGAECKEMLDLASVGRRNMSGEAKAEVVQRCSALIKKIDQPYSVGWLTAIRDELQFESEYALGMTASLPFNNELSHWVCGDLSQFTWLSSDSVLIDTTQSLNPLSMVSMINTEGASKDIEFDIALDKSPKNRGDARHFTPSVSVMNYRGAAFAFGLNRSYHLKKTAGSSFNLAQFSFGWKRGEGDLYFYNTPIDIESNRIRLKILPGYFEAYLNDRFICRSASKEIRGALDSFEICQPLSRRGRGTAKISGITIKKLYGTAPPVKEGPEKLVEYYKLDFDEDPGDKWAAYWFGQATHMAGDTEKAIELYMTAIDNGMAEHVPAFFLGDCHDRQGDTSEAIRWYKIASAVKLEDVTEVFKRPSSQNYTNSCHWAALRLSWLMRSSPDDSLRSSMNVRGFCRMGATDKHLWVVRLISAMSFANEEGDFKKALRVCDSLSAKCSPEDKPVLDAVLDAWRAGKEYRDVAGETPLYLKLEDPIPFFRCFEDCLGPEWKGVY